MSVLSTLPMSSLDIRAYGAALMTRSLLLCTPQVYHTTVHNKKWTPPRRATCSAGPRPTRTRPCTARSPGTWPTRPRTPRTTSAPTTGRWLRLADRRAFASVLRDVAGGIEHSANSFQGTELAVDATAAGCLHFSAICLQRGEVRAKAARVRPDARRLVDSGAVRDPDPPADAHPEPVPAARHDRRRDALRPAV